jgi:hypothetical protein
MAFAHYDGFIVYEGILMDNRKQPNARFEVVCAVIAIAIWFTVVVTGNDKLTPFPEILSWVLVLIASRKKS